MTKGFSINGWVFLLVLLSLFAGSYYLGGVKSRREAKSLTFALQVDQRLISGLSTQLEEKDKLLLEQKLSCDFNIGAYKALVNEYNRFVNEYNRLYQKAEAKIIQAQLELKTVRDSAECHKEFYLDGSYGHEETLELRPDTFFRVDCATFLPLL